MDLEKTSNYWEKPSKDLAEINFLSQPKSLLLLSVKMESGYQLQERKISSRNLVKKAWIFWAFKP